MKTLNFLVVHSGWLIIGFIPLYALCYLVYFIVSLPLKRHERARFFLDLIETGLAQGRSIEQTIISISQSRDHSVGVHFHLLAAYLESGWALIPALEKVPSLLPPQLVAMLKAGDEIGDMKKVLPACRTLLKDGSSQTRSAYNYLVVLAFVLIPIIPALFWMMTVFVLPRFQQIFADMLEAAPLPVPPFSHFAVALSQIQLALALLFYICAIFYVGGPRMIAWLQAGFAVPSFDWISYGVPWRRKRMQRDFAAMLAVLLDAGVPEDRAVSLAAESAANQIFVRRADRVVTQLKQGVKLTEAMRRFDNSGEFRWRLANAVQSGRNFFTALSGWLETLDAKAFQQEQATAQLITTALVLYNGVMVSFFAVFVFRCITLIIEEGVLW